MTQLAQVFNSTDTQELLAAASVDFTQKAPVSKYKKNRSEGAPKKPGSAYNCFLSSRSKVGVCARLVGCVHVGGYGVQRVRIGVAVSLVRLYGVARTHHHASAASCLRALVSPTPHHPMMW